MPTLTRHRSSDRSDCWHVYYGGIRVGTIAARAGVPVDVDQWGWHADFTRRPTMAGTLMARQRRSSRRAPSSKPRGESISRNAPKPILEKIDGMEGMEEICDVGSRLQDAHAINQRPCPLFL